MTNNRRPEPRPSRPQRLQRNVWLLERSSEGLEIPGGSPLAALGPSVAEAVLRQGMCRRMFVLRAQDSLAAALPISRDLPSYAEGYFRLAPGFVAEEAPSVRSVVSFFVLLTGAAAELYAEALAAAGSRASHSSNIRKPSLASAYP